MEKNMENEAETVCSLGAYGEFAVYGAIIHTNIMLRSVWGTLYHVSGQESGTMTLVIV